MAADAADAAVLRRARVAVIGGGMAGLAAARMLEDARTGQRAPDASGQRVPAADWVLYERDPRLGGKVFTERRDGFVIEGGPDSAIIEKPLPIQMARRLGIADRLLDSNEDIRKSFVYSGGKLHEFPEGIILMVPTRIVPFAMSSLMSWPGKFRMGMDLLLPRGQAQDDESLGDFVRRRLGKEALAKIAEPIVAGIHAGDPEQMSVQATFPMFREMERQYRSLVIGMLKRRRARARIMAEAAAKGGVGVGAPGAPGAGGAGQAGAGGAAAGPRTGPTSYFYSFKTGLADLSDAITASLPAERLRSGVGVERVEKISGGSAACVYRLTLSDGSTTEADALVFATPAWASGALLRTVAPRAAADLESIDYVSTATVSVAFRRDQVTHPLKGFGLVVPRAENRDVMATTWSSSKFAHRVPDDQHVMVRSFLGRAGLEKAAQLDDEEMTKLVRSELGEVLGISAEPVLSSVFRWPQGMPQYKVGHSALVDRIESAVVAIGGVELAGGAYHGIGIGDCMREGAAAALRALEHIAGTPEDPIPPQPHDVPAGDGVTD